MTDTAKTASAEIRLCGRLVCASSRQAKAVQDHLPEHLRLTRAEPGCISFDVCATDDAMVWNVKERFQDQQAFEFHQRRTRASAWWSATKDIPRYFDITGPT